MGEISGLDIIKECKENSCESHFIIISGHDNFDYAHAAVNLGAVYYLLKPIDLSDIEVLKEKLKKTLCKNKSTEISNHLSSKESFNAYIYNLLDDKQYRFVIGNLKESRKNELSDIFCGGISGDYLIGSNKYLFLVKNDCITRCLLEELNTFALQNGIIISISDAFTKEESSYEHFMRANELSYHYFLVKSGRLLLEPLSSDTTVLKDILNDLFSAIDSKYLVGIKNIFSELPGNFIKQNYTMTHVVWFYNTLVGKINITYNPSDAFPFSQLDAEDLLTHFRTLDNLCSDLFSALNEMIAPLDKTNINSNELWIKISDYIEKNYTKRIQVSDICSEFFISSKTLYNVTMANTGKSYLEYLTFFRLEKAKKLLRTTPMSVSEIAEKVGIKDHYYLNRIFKKFTGVTPLQYKNEGGHKEE